MTNDWEKRADSAANKYADETIHVSELGPEAEADILIRNLRFMAYSTGYSSGVSALACRIAGMCGGGGQSDADTLRTILKYCKELDQAAKEALDDE